MKVKTLKGGVKMGWPKYAEDNMEIYLERTDNKITEKDLNAGKRTPAETKIVRK
jgi:hypothetical protein